MHLWVCLTSLNREKINFCFVSLFLRAHSLSPTDHLAAFYLALQLAISRQVSCFKSAASCCHTKIRICICWWLEMNISSIKTWFSLCTYSQIWKKPWNTLPKPLQSYAVLQNSAIISSSRIRNKTEVIPLTSPFMLLDREKKKSVFKVF